MSRRTVGDQTFTSLNPLLCLIPPMKLYGCDTFALQLALCPQLHRDKEHREKDVEVVDEGRYARKGEIAMFEN